jgi:hypothetical protein
VRQEKLFTVMECSVLWDRKQQQTTESYMMGEGPDFYSESRRVLEDTSDFTRVFDVELHLFCR